jgi:hypothetical protein
MHVFFRSSPSRQAGIANFQFANRAAEFGNGLVSLHLQEYRWVAARQANERAFNSRRPAISII